MIPELKEPKFMPMFISCFMQATNPPGPEHLFLTKTHEPIECQVVSTKPKFIVSDGYHKVTCIFTNKSIVSLKRGYQQVSIKDLEKKFIILKKYTPCTNLLEGNKLELALVLLDITLCSLECNKADRVKGKPAELEEEDEVKACGISEVNKHLKKNLQRYKKLIASTPQLENILRNKTTDCPNLVIKFDENEGPYEGAVDYNSIEKIEEHAAEQAREELEAEKQMNKKLKEQQRRKFAERRKAPKSLNKELASLYVKTFGSGSAKKKAVSAQVQKQIADIISIEDKEVISTPMGTKKRSTSKAMSVSKSVKETEKKQSVYKITARGFKGFIDWKACVGNVDHEAANVSEVLKKAKPGSIKVDFETPAKPGRKAFSNWVESITPEKKRLYPEDIPSKSSLAKSSAKKGKY